MKVKIFTEGGKAIGLGHLSRCSSLYDEVKIRGIAAEIIVNGEIDNIKFLEDKVVTKANWLDERILSENLDKDDLVIVDSYLATKDLYETISNRVSKALYIDDNFRLDYPKGIIINPSVSIDSINYPNEMKERVLFGEEYVILRSAFLCEKYKNITQDVSKVLIMIGGTDHKNITMTILEAVSEKFTNIKFEVIVGQKNINEEQDFSKTRNVSFHQNINADEMFNLMLECDFAITACGQTIYELIATKTPFIGIKTIENQENNARFVREIESKDLILNVEDSDWLNNLINAFRSLLDYAKRLDISEKLKEKNLVFGSKNIINELISIENSMSIKLRKACAEDKLAVFELSNQDYVRKYSINKNKILWEDHEKWFANILLSKNNVFFVAVDNFDNFLGQVRFNISESECVVSISLSSSIKGRGYSKLILSESIKQLFEDDSNINEVVAYINEKNIASFKLFTSLGFEVVSSENNLLRLIYRRGKNYENR